MAAKDCCETSSCCERDRGYAGFVLLHPTLKECNDGKPSEVVVPVTAVAAPDCATAKLLLINCVTEKKNVLRRLEVIMLLTGDCPEEC